MELLLFSILFVGLVAGSALILSRYTAAKEVRLTLITYRELREPIYVLAQFPGDNSLESRAEQERKLLARAGNQFDNGEPVPVYVKPYLTIPLANKPRHTSMNHYIIVTAAEMEAELSSWRGALRKVNSAAFARHFAEN